MTFRPKIKQAKWYIHSMSNAKVDIQGVNQSHNEQQFQSTNKKISGLCRGHFVFLRALVISFIFRTHDLRQFFNSVDNIWSGIRPDGTFSPCVNMEEFHKRYLTLSICLEINITVTVCSLLENLCGPLL